MSLAIDAAGEKLSVKNLRARAFKIFSRWKLSSQISLTYGLIFFVTLILMNIATTAGVYYLFHHQAARAIEISIDRTKNAVSNIRAIDENFFKAEIIPPNVNLRVIDKSGRKILDTSPSFPSNEKILANIRHDPPFWSDKNFALIETPRALFYYKELPLEIGGEILHFHFFAPVTFEKNFIQRLLWTLFLLDLFGLFFALVAGIFLGRKVLKPLRQVTQTAREISAGTIDRRLTLEKSCDEVNKLTAAFNKMLDRLEESFVQQQKFIADASHELRTPVTVIRGYADMLDSYGAEDPELLKESTAEIKKSARNMQYLVESLLFLARADQGTQPLNKMPVDIGEILLETVESFCTPRIEFIDDEPFEISGDAGFLEKMFAAFIDNALNFSTGEVIVRLKNFGDVAEVKIIDSGIGIAPENIARIFDRFFKVDAARTITDEDKISAGLGLSIAKWVADKHGIKIGVESELGGGTSFTLTIPR